ncbi:MAG: hypothetical protein WD513_02560, partial [Balneolaceae bacterium]
IFKKAEQERNQTDAMFKLLGWNSLPADLKFEIEEDVRGYYEELHGFYSTSCEYVQRRRESVDFWVRSFKDGLCTLQTAVESLRVNRI